MGLRDDLDFIVSKYEPRADLEPGLKNALLERFSKVEWALQEFVDGRDGEFEYEMSTSPGRLDGTATLPIFHFAPRGEGRHQRNPQLHCMILIPEDVRKLYVLLTDHRHPRDSPDDKKQRKQIEQVRVLLQRATDDAWRFESARPPIKSPKTEGDGEELSTFARGVIFFRDFDAELLPPREKLLETVDKLLRLREIYTERYRSQDLDELLERVSYAEMEPESEEGIAEPEEVAAKNVILFGPPGTGKTYSTTRRALELCGELESDEELSDAEMAHRFRQLRGQGRIEFVTFHQSYGYEEFVEGIRPELEKTKQDSDQSGSGDVIYDVRSGKFKEIALLAASEGLELTPPDREFEARWETLRSQIEDAGRFTVRSRSDLEFEVQIIGKGEFRLVRVDEGGFRTTDYTVQRRIAKNWWDARDTLGTDYHRLQTDVVKRNVSKPGNYTAYWIMYRLLMEIDEEELRRNLSPEGELSPSQRKERVEEYIGDSPSKNFGSFKDAKQYVIIIDEINRANISKVMGELITLLEPDKRLRAKNEMTVSLPHSDHHFGVPPNLHVLGTMNTADRSIALMDTALRRRFDFEEMMPDPAVVRGAVVGNLGADSLDDVDDDDAMYLVNLVVALMETINKRVTFLYDRDHQIGHSYFMGVEDLETLRVAFVDRIIPLLQEYFYGSWDRLCIVLGCPYEEDGSPRRRRVDSHVFVEGRRRYRAPMINADKLSEEKVLRMEHPEHQDRLHYEVATEFAEAPEPGESEGDDERRQMLRRYFEAVLSAPDRQKVLDGEYVKEFEEQS